MEGQVVGRCSLCGGDVLLPKVWAGVGPAPKTCSWCGAIEARPDLPVIPMKNPGRAKYLTADEIEKMFNPEVK